jgi:flagellar FliL protein
MSEQQATAEAPAAKSSGGVMGKLLIAGFLGGVVAVECLLAYFLIPDAEQVAALAEKKMALRLPETLAGSELAADETETNATVEERLGDYSITVSQPNASTALRVDFALVGTVLEEDSAEVKKLFERHEHRFRDQIFFEFRNSEPADLADPRLGLIKRRILEKSNALFGKPVLRSVVFSQFSYVEQ